jgi:glutamate dehydrogenase
VSETDGNSRRESQLKECADSEKFREFPDALSDFAGAYLHRAPADYLKSADPEQVCAHIACLFDFVARSNQPEGAVRVFNPDLTTHGYETHGAVVEVVVPDMPFLIDSVSNELKAGDLDIEWKVHSVIGIDRQEGAAIVAVVPARGAAHRTSFQHYELQRSVSAAEADVVADGVRRVLRAVRSAVSDFEPMQGAIYRMIKVAREGTQRYDRPEIDETVSFLEWLLDENFIFLGYREYEIEQTERGDAISVVPGSGLGILSRDADSMYVRPVLLTDTPAGFRERVMDGDLLVLTKTNQQSPVHRRAKMDYIGVRRLTPDGRVIGEARLIGLFTGKAYMSAADAIPIVRRKLRQILEAEDTIDGSHYYKQIVQIFNSFPKDDLFGSSTEGIRARVVGLIEAQEQEGVRLFVQRDLLQRNVSILVVVPRDRFSAGLRKALQAYFVERYSGRSVDYQLSLDETDTARVHFTVWVGQGEMPDVSFEELEEAVLARTRTWEERVTDVLVDELGETRGSRLGAFWPGRFPEYYRTSVDLALVVGDVERLEEVRAGDSSAVVGLQNQRDQEDSLTRLAVYRTPAKLELSTIMPTLEDLGLKVVEEVPTRLASDDGDYFIHDFGVLDAGDRLLDVEVVGVRVAEAISCVLDGSCESDSLHRLILTSGLNYHQVRILRAYRTYWQRVRPGFTVEYLNDAFAAHPLLAQQLVAYFEARFDPASVVAADPIAAGVVAALEHVASLDEDRILRGFLALVDATVRTSYYRPGSKTLSFKFRSVDVPDMPAPAPLFEIFVYADDVEGVHLRGGLVARGGIRWSTRKEDYRTEVLGLMKAQMTKNAVIVPTGSKGGFVLRDAPTERSDLLGAVRSGYETFIRGLLDLTDNLVDGQVARPEGVVVLDDEDPYLVVAADKGTASFSDLANRIAAEYRFWLGDAFASGGSVGYDHKDLAITARGAWQFVRWHFNELGIDVDSAQITAIGIGDMSGDVFGNGVLISKQLKLVAAFDHRHIFIDPDPDPSLSWHERRRLYDSPNSTWAAYNRDLLSPGGGIWDRAAKKIELSEEAVRALAIDENALTPARAIQAILRAPVDLMWNGGIGTFVKASSQVDAEADDRTNDAIRVDARDLRCRVVCEGGNLGFTQEGRIEFSRRGGRINADFMDNSAGVNCSDREVNLKVLLGVAEERGTLDRPGRNQLVHDVAGDVVERILYDNFLQAQILSHEAYASADAVEAYEEVMGVMERAGLLDRGLERLPSTEDLSERTRLGSGITGPELAVLVAYSKRLIRGWILDSDLPESGEFDEDLASYFPRRVVDRFAPLLGDHPLRREMASTIVANDMVNSQGIAFVTKLMAETGAPPARIVAAYRTAISVTDAVERRKAVEALFTTVSPEIGSELFAGVGELVGSVTRWYLGHPSTRPTGEAVPETAAAVRLLSERIAEQGAVSLRGGQPQEVQRLVAVGVPEAVAIRHAYQRELVHAPAIIEVAGATKRGIGEVAEVFLLVGSTYALDWLEQEVSKFTPTTRWQRRAQQVIKDDLTLLQRELAEKALTAHADAPGAEAVARYRAVRPEALERLSRFMRSLELDGADDVSSVVVAIRRIRALGGGEPDDVRRG